MIELISGTSRGIRLGQASLQALHRHAAQVGSMATSLANTLSLPLVGRVAAGSPILAQEHIDQSYCLQSSLFEQTPDYLLRVRGMSMRDAGILDGDLLAVRATKEARNGQIIVARLGDEVTVKRLRKSAKLLELLPENPDFPIIQVRPGEPFEVEGLAVGLIRSSAL